MNGLGVMMAPLLFIGVFVLVGGIIAWLRDVPVYIGLLLGLCFGPLGWVLTGLIGYYGVDVLRERIRSVIAGPQQRSGPAARFSVADELAKLAALRKSGALTEGEFTEQKRRLLAR